MPTTDDHDDRVTKPFADWLTQQRKGVLNVEAGAALADLVDRIRETGKSGALVLTLKIKPGKANTLEVTDDVTLRLPEHDREAALWFADGDSNLVRHDPDQMSLPLGPRAVPDDNEQPQEAIAP